MLVDLSVPALAPFKCMETSFMCRQWGIGGRRFPGVVSCRLEAGRAKGKDGEEGGRRKAKREDERLVVTAIGEVVGV